MMKEWLVKTLSIGIILLFICMSITPSTAVDNIKKSPTPTFDGNTLYVGGNGTGNYTKIQDAIDNATDGDTVFVFNGIYQENIIINKEIAIKGENKYNTSIDGKNNNNVVLIKHNNVTFSGFTILHSGSYDAGLYVQSYYSLIYDNIFLENKYGIIITESFKSKITNNLIFNNSYGIYILFENKGCEIFRNELFYNFIGIWHFSSQSRPWVANVFSYNNIHDNHIGFFIDEAMDTNIIRNNFVNNEEAIFLLGGQGFLYFKVHYNNFITNKQDINNISVGPEEITHRISDVFNRFRGNYWNRPRLFPKFLYGDILWLRLFPELHWVVLPWFNIDLRPALKPYDIPTGV